MSDEDADLQTFHPYLCLCGKFAAESENEMLTASSLGYYWPKECFCLIVAYNRPIQYKINSNYDYNEDKKIFRAYPINLKEMCLHDTLIRVSNNLKYNACYKEIHIISSKKYAILNWDMKSCLKNPAMLIKDKKCLSSIKYYLYLKYELINKNNQLLLTSNEVCHVRHINCNCKYMYFVFIIQLETQ